MTSDALHIGNEMRLDAGVTAAQPGEVVPRGEIRGEILFLCHRIPFPPDRGDKIRSFHMLKALAQEAPVHVGCFADDERDMGFAGEMARITTSQYVVRRTRSRIVAGVAGLINRQPMLVAMYEKPQLQRWVEQILRERPISTIFAYSVQMAHFVPEKLPDGTRFLMDFVDFDSAKYAAYGQQQGGPMGWVYRREGRVLHDFERQVANRADRAFFVSDAEARMFIRSGGTEGRHIGAIENGVNLEYFHPKADFPKIEAPGWPLIVFTGQMDYRPNIEAVESFTREAMPAIRAQHPGAVFAIVGRSPTPQVEALAQLPGIIVTGSVPDVRGWLAAADVVVAPLRIARGIQNKVLEAMAMARPVVASPDAAEGIDVENGTHIIIAPDIWGEAQAVLALLEDKDGANALGKAARIRVSERYDWSATLAPLRAMVAEGEAEEALPG